MDPEATLRLALDALTEGDTDEAVQALRDYLIWRRNGGFAPDVTLSGDVLADVLQRALGGAA